jgi:hypothetical protein
MVSAIITIAREDVSIGIVEWIAQLCTAATIFVLLLSWRRRLTYAIASVSALLGVIIAFFEG